jgi:lambda family phage portal protein
MKKLGTFIDNAISVISPAWAARRANARAQFELSTFAAAENSRLTRDWKAKQVSADAAILFDMDTINARARMAERDDWAAGSIVDGYRRHVVGTGITCRSDARDANGEQRKDFNRKADRLFRNWANNKKLCDTEQRKTLLGIQELAITEFATVGEAFAVLDYTPRTGVSGLRIRMFEPEQLDSVSTINPTNQNEIRRGIEIDDDGAPIAYWVYDRHPQDYSMPGGYVSPVARRIPAEQVLHLMRQTRASQTHGYTRFARVLPKLRKLARYDDFMSVRAQFEAAICMTIESQEQTTSSWMTPGPSATPPVLQDDGSTEIDIRPGMVNRMPPGTTGKIHVPTSPGGTYQPFMHQQLKEVSAGAGLDYQTTARDFDWGSFSSQRQALIERNGETDPLQMLLITDWLKPIRDAFITMEIMEGRLSAPGFGMADEDADQLWLNCKYCPPGKPWVDPANQAAASKIQIDYRLKSRDEIIQEINGVPCTEVFDQIDDEQEYALEELASESRPNGIGLPEVMPTGNGPAVNPREPRPKGVANSPAGIEGGTVVNPDGTTHPSDQPAEQVDSEVIGNRLDAYGVGVRAGSITPQMDDENTFRKQLGLPPLGPEGQEAWKKDKGTRRPITLAPPPGQAPASPFGSAPANPPEDDSEGDALSRRRSLNGVH